MQAQIVNENQKPIRSWGIVFGLCLLFALSFVDRLLLALLAQPVSMELGLSDTQVGLLIGLGFAIVYSLAGIPLAHLIDTRRRMPIVFIGVAIWSISTIVSGFAQTFFVLLLSRIGLAIGEAVLSPAAISLIGDLFPREKRAAPMALYSSIAGVMGTGGFIVGGLALSFGEQLSPLVGFSPWRLTFIILGLPTLLVGLIFWLATTEPPREEAAEEHVPMKALIQYLRRSYLFYIPMMAGSAILACFVYGMAAWVPTILVRSYGLENATAGYTYGAVGVPAGLLGSVLWPYVATRIGKNGSSFGTSRALVVLAIIATPMMIAAPLMPDTALFLILMFFVVLCGSGLAVLPPLAIQGFSSARMRARLASLQLLGLNMIGFALGPLAIVWLGQLWPNATIPISAGLSTLGVVTGPLAILCFGLSHYGLSRMRDVSNEKEAR